MAEYKTIIYFQHINSIGGVETYEYELVKKYSATKDITIFYVSGDLKQIKRLKQFVKVIKYQGEEVECDQVFVNYGFQPFLDHCHAKEYYQVIHADYLTQRITPNLDSRFTYICVSELVRDHFSKVTGIPKEKMLLSYNPVQIETEERRPCLILGSFTRLIREKGKERMEKLAKRLDSIPNFHYIWLVYTNDVGGIDSPNVAYMPPTIDCRNAISTCDYVVQLSDCEGFSYTINEAKHLTKILRTPFPSADEMGGQDLILNFDLSNLEEVVKELVKAYNEKPLKNTGYKPLNDNYDTIIHNNHSNYKEEKEKMMKLETLMSYFDVVEKRIRPLGEIFEVENERGEELLANKYKIVKVLEVTPSTPSVLSKQVIEPHIVINEEILINEEKPSVLINEEKPKKEPVKEVKNVRKTKVKGNSTKTTRKTK